MNFCATVPITVFGRAVEVEVECSYHPEEPAHYGEPGYPGCPAELEILRVWWDEAEISLSDLRDDEFEDLHQSLLWYLEEDDTNG